MKFLSRMMFAAGLAVVLFASRGLTEAPNYSLGELISRAVTSSPEIKEAQFDVDFAKARLDEANAGKYGIIEFIGLGGLHSDARANGETIYGTDSDGNTVAIPEVEYLGTRDSTNEYQGFSPFVRGELTVIIPVWTWGKLEGYVKAATAGIGVEEAKAEIKKGEVIRRIKEFFYGYLLASDALDLGKEVGDNVDKAIKKATELLEEGTGEVSQTDLERLYVGKAELNRQLAEAKQGLPMARAALVGFTKVETNFTTSPVYLEMQKLQHEKLEDLIELTWKSKPELKQLAKGIEARDNLVKVEESEYYPILFVGAQAWGGWSDGRSVSHNPFLNDGGFGPLQGGPALGMKWNLNFWTTEAKVNQARAQYRGLKAKEEFARIGVPLQIEQAYRKVLEHRTKEQEASEGTRAARRWMISAVNNYDVGIGEPRTLMEGIGAYGMMKISQLKARYDYNMALADLSQVVGHEITDLSY